METNRDSNQSNSPIGFLTAEEKTNGRRPARRRPLGRRLMLAIGVMLIPILAVAGTGILTFRTSVSALEEVQDETLAESARIDALREMLPQADDLGESYIEDDEPGMQEAFDAISVKITTAFDNIVILDQQPSSDEQRLVTSARDLWTAALESANTAASLPAGKFDEPLDEFHDSVDEAASTVADLYTAHAREVADEITTLQWRENIQLFTALATLLIGTLVAMIVTRKLHRSITRPLLSLEEAAERFGNDDLLHRVSVTGDHELSRVGDALNAMAMRLQQSRSELEHQALHDPLTGLPNRALFMERIELGMARARRRGSELSLLYIDLDGFKKINDTLGHEAGDDLLLAVAKHFESTVRAEDTVARLGGDEFGILLEDTGSDGAAVVAGELSRIVDLPCRTRRGKVRVGASVGVSTWRGEVGLDEFLHEADIAMYEAKHDGRGPYQVFDPTRTHESRSPVALGAELRDAIAAGRLVLHYQPLVSVRDGETIGFEALVRWNHPIRGLLQPFEFLPSAEQTGVMIELDRWVLHEACRQLAEWTRKNEWFESLVMSVNVSAGHFDDPALVSTVTQIITETGVNPHNLRLEVSERTLMRDKDGAAATIRTLKSMGISIWLDDFGMGYSSLSYLRNFSLDALKIDRTFVADVASGKLEAAIPKAIIKLADAMQLDVVAEGVENASQRRELERLGCRMAQGFLYSKPVPAAKIERMARSKRPSSRLVTVGSPTVAFA